MQSINIYMQYTNIYMQYTNISVPITRIYFSQDQCPSTTNVFKKRLISLLRLVFCVKSHAREDEL